MVKIDWFWGQNNVISQNFVKIFQKKKISKILKKILVGVLIDDFA